MDEVLRRQYLAAMGIQGWLPRTAGEAEPDRGSALDAADPVITTVASSSADAPNSAPDDLSSPSVAAGKPDKTKLPEAVADSPPGPVLEEVPPWLDDVPPPTDEWAPAESIHLDEIDMPAPVDEIAGLDWDALEYRVARCEACELSKSRSHTVFGVGDRAADLMVIGEAPGAEEDRQGKPFVGRAGQLLDAMLLAIGLQREQVYIANILKCRPPGNRDPRPEEALKCEPYLQRQVALVQPKVILAVGRVAAQNLLKSQEAVGRMRGKEYRYNDIPLVVTYHPAYLLRSPDQKGKAWQDLQRTVRLLRQG
jgi:DNA polymerase